MEPAGGTAVSPPVARRLRRRWPGASLVTGSVVVAAVWSLVAIPLHLILPRTVATVDELFETFSIPAGHTFFSAVYLGVLATALRQGKRIAILWVFWVFGVLGVVAALGNIGVDLDVGSGGDPQDHRSLLLPHELLNVAALVLAVAVALLAWQVRRGFPARLTPGSRWRAVAVLVAGLSISVTVSILLTEAFPRSLRGQRDKIFWAVSAAFGRSASLTTFGDAGHAWVAYIVGAVSAATLILALAVFLRSVRKDHVLSQDNELRVRRLLLEYGDHDSLGYFATRRDKAMIWSPQGDAALAYRVIAGVSLVSGDPVGDPEAWPAVISAWLDEARRYGWAPGVLSAGEAGATAFVEAGLRALTMGDEAVIDVADFTLEGRTMRPVRQAVARARRAGYRATVVRQGELTPQQHAQLESCAHDWRGAQTERGFSMALSRLGDASDDRCLAVLAHGPDEDLQGILLFVPWGAHGISLDLMRRDPASVNGLIEFMVSSVVEESAHHGVDRVSLNFAMFREVFSDAERIGAGPVVRVANRALMVASRFWQLQSLYQSNEKYLPRWCPRFICYGRNHSLAQVLVAAGIAEGFLPGPRPARRVDSARSSGSGLGRLDAPAFAAAVRQQEADHTAAPLPAVRNSEQEEVRRAKLQRLVDEGLDPYPGAVARTHSLAAVASSHANLPADAHTGETVSVAGRVEALRGHGNLCFAVLSESVARLQVMLDRSVLGDAPLTLWHQVVDVGDLVSVTGEVVTSRRGELSVSAKEWTMAAKCLRPLPAARSRCALQPALQRTTVVTALRDALVRRGYAEVETPGLLLTAGGPIFELAEAPQGVGPEAGLDGRRACLEAYEPYGDDASMAALAGDLVLAAATALHGGPLAHRRQGDGSVVPVDISGGWPVVPFYEAVSRALRETVTPRTSADRLRVLCAERQVRVTAGLDGARLALAAFDQLVRPATTLPTTYVGFPLAVSPRARERLGDPGVAARQDLVMLETVVATAYSELTDPLERSRRVAEDTLPPATAVADDELGTTLEYAVPPTGTLRLSLDTLLEVLTGLPVLAGGAGPA